MRALPSEQAHLARERERICKALVEVVAEHGYGQTDLEALLEHAALDQEAFDQHFSGLDDCFRQLWEDLKQEFLQRTADAYMAPGNWRDGIRAASWTYCRFLQEDPDRARFFLIEFTFAGEAVQASSHVVVNRFIELVHLGRYECTGAAAIPRTHAEAILGAIWMRVAAMVKAGAFAELPEQVPQLMYLNVMPYLGPEAAEEELRRGPADIASYMRGEL